MACCQRERQPLLGRLCGQQGRLELVKKDLQAAGPLISAFAQLARNATCKAYRHVDLTKQVFGATLSANETSFGATQAERLEQPLHMPPMWRNEGARDD